MDQLGRSTGAGRPSIDRPFRSGSRVLYFFELARVELDRVVGDAVTRPAEVADQRQVDLAADHPQHAVELVGGQLEPAAQELERRARQELLGLLEPAERGDAVDAIDRADLVD